MSSSPVKAIPQTATPVALPVSTPQPPTEHNGSSSSRRKSEVAKEQSFLKEKARRMSQFFTGVKAGEVKATLPSNNNIETVLVGGADNIDKFQQSERGSKLSEQNHIVLNDIKGILVQENAILKERNNQEQAQNFVSSSIAVAKDIGNNPLVKETLQKWRADLVDTMQRKDWRGFAKFGDNVIATLRQTEAFLELTVELANIAKILNNKVGGERSVVLEQRDTVLTELRTTLKVLSTNQLWRQFTAIRDPVPAQKKEEINALQGVVSEAHLEQLTESGQTLLQALVGDAVSVQPFLTATRDAIQYVMHNHEFINIVKETQTLFAQIAENPSLADDSLTQASLKLILDKLEFASTSLLQNENIKRVRVEGDKLMGVVKRDPMNMALLDGLLKLRTDANSSDILAGVRSVVIPLIMEHLNNIPLSTIRTSINAFGTTDIEISDLRLPLRDLLPKNINVKLEYEFDGNAQDFTVTQQKLIAKINIKNLQIHVDNASWKWTRGTSVDHGKASFHTSGKGISLSLIVAIMPGGDPMITVEHAKCKMDTFSLVFSESQHNKFYSIITSLSSRSIRTNIQKAITNKLKDMGPIVEAKMKDVFGKSKTKLEQVRAELQQQKEAKKAKKQSKNQNTLPPKVLPQLQKVEPAGAEMEVKEPVMDVQPAPLVAGSGMM